MGRQPRADEERPQSSHIPFGGLPEGYVNQHREPVSITDDASIQVDPAHASIWRHPKPDAEQVALGARAATLVA